MIEKLRSSYWIGDIREKRTGKRMELVGIIGVMGKDWMIQLPKENVIRLKEGDELCLPYFVDEGKGK